MKALAYIITVLVLAVSIPAEADLLDKAYSAYDKLLGRVSLVCKTDKQAKYKAHGLHPNNKYNIVIRIRKPGKVLAIKRHKNNYNYDESDGFSFSEISDKYIKLRYTGGRKPIFILIDRYDGLLTVDDGGGLFLLIIGKCKQGQLDSKKKF